MAQTWYGNQSPAEGCRFGELALIYPLIERMGIRDIINQHLPADPQAEWDYGTTLSLLMAARLYSPVALLNVAQWAQQSGADMLWEMPLEKINDDRLGRALDKFFTQRHSILAYLTMRVSEEFNVPIRELHYDPTDVMFTGVYESAQPRDGVVDGDRVRSDERLAPAHITKGKGSEKTPVGAVLVHAGICTQVDEFGPLPLFGHTVDGNQNGRTAIHEQWALLRKHVKLDDGLIMFSDRGTFSIGHLARLYQEGFSAVCSVPWGDFRALFEGNRKKLVWDTASYLSIEQQRRRKQNSTMAREHYELAVLRHELHDKASGQTIPCRMIFVFSTADQKTVRQQRQKQIDKIRTGLERIQDGVAQGRPQCDAQAVQRRVGKLLGSKDAARYFSWTLVPLTKAEQKKLPPGGRGCRQATHRFEFGFDEEQLRCDEQNDGYSALVTTVPQPKGSADTLFTKFKEQNYSEQVNRGLKGPLAVRPVFLHSPQRVEALLFLMLAALMVYYLLQRIYRQAVPDEAPATEKRMTARTILKAFNSYTLNILKKRHGREVQPTQLTKRQRAILQQLRFPTPAQILSKLLPHPPT